MKNIRAATTQIESVDGDKAANFAVMKVFVEQAAQQKVEMLVFPELCITGCWFLTKLSREELEALAEPVFDGPSSQQLLAWAKEYNMTIGAGLIEIVDDGELYNTYVVAMPDGQMARHRKIHCFVSEHMASGSEYTVFDTPHGVRVGVLICYDNNITENVRMTALKGAEVLLAPHQTGGCETNNPNIMGIIDRKLWDNRHENPEAIEAEFKGPKGREWLMRWVPARAHDNGLFLIFSNGVGVDANEIRTGNAMIIDPCGRVITETWKAGNDMIVADLDGAFRDGCLGQSWIKTRRPELYKPLAETTGLEEDLRKVRFEV